MSRQESEKFVEEARLLLPWYLTNTLSDEEQDLVNRALEASPELRKEFVREEKMMRLVKENTSLLELSALDTTEQRLENTLARIERDEQSEAATEINDVLVKQPLAAKITDSWFDRLFKHKLLDMEWLSPANAVFASLLALNVGVLGFHQLNQPDGQPGQVEYKSDMVYSAQSSSEAVATKQSSPRKQFLMEFQPGAEYGEVCNFLNKINAHVVDGPTDHNVFTIEMQLPPHVDVDAFADKIVSEASGSNAPVVFFGPKF